MVLGCVGGAGRVIEKERSRYAVQEVTALLSASYRSHGVARTLWPVSGRGLSIGAVGPTGDRLGTHELPVSQCPPLPLNVPEVIGSHLCADVPVGAVLASPLLPVDKVVRCPRSVSGQRRSRPGSDSQQRR